VVIRIKTRTVIVIARMYIVRLLREYPFFQVRGQRASGLESVKEASDRGLKGYIVLRDMGWKGGWSIRFVSVN
jgi:hypothetical protein